MAAADKVDPIHQFHINKIIPIEFGGYDLSFTNSSLFMVATVLVASLFLYLATSGRHLIPSRWQSSAEMTYEFVGSMLKDSAGSQGMRFFPLVFSLFMFILTANLLGLFPLSIVPGRTLPLHEGRWHTAESCGPRPSGTSVSSGRGRDCSGRRSAAAPRRRTRDASRATEVAS